MTFLSRINRIHIIAAGAVVFVGLLAAFGFAFMQPTVRELKTIQEQQEKQEATWRQLPARVATLSEAQQMVATTKAAAEQFVASMPRVGTEPFDPFDSMFLLHQEFTTGAGPKLYQFFVSQGFAPRGISVPSPPLQPTMPVPVLTIPMGGFGVQARSFPAVLRLLRELKDMPRLGVISGVSLRGTSPFLDVTMPLTVYIITPQALVPGAAAAVAARGRLGAAGGRPRIRLQFGRRD